MKTKKTLKSVIAASAFALMSANALAAGESLGSMAQGHWADEAGGIFQFVILAFAFVGVVIAGTCLIGMAMIKMAPNNPATQKFEQAGTGNLGMGALFGAGLAALMTVLGFFIGTAAGTDADTDGLNRLRGSSIVEPASVEYIASVNADFTTVRAA
ncbi:hypothetical protein SAMN05421647_11354 [Marinobacterium stanieri]|uniref:Integral membrane protein n=2 Tax=Marinobacterium stanieri TaxID=49186 RepID=A0A1N6XB14_9GAMM|nr:hypothetical protein SAMN05421647_11354 [Marinobacterium stanieri]